MPEEKTPPSKREKIDAQLKTAREKKPQPKIYPVYSKSEAGKDDHAGLYSKRATFSLNYSGVDVDNDFDFIKRMEEDVFVALSSMDSELSMSYQEDDNLSVEEAINKARVLEIEIKINKVIFFIEQAITKIKTPERSIAELNEGKTNNPEWEQEYNESIRQIENETYGLKNETHGEGRNSELQQKREEAQQKISLLKAQRLQMINEKNILKNLSHTRSESNPLGHQDQKDLSLSLRNMDEQTIERLIEKHLPNYNKKIVLEKNEAALKKVNELKENINNALYEFVKDIFLNNRDTNISDRCIVEAILLPGNFYNMEGEGRNSDQRRAYFQKAVMKLCKEYGIPLYGICGGMQHIAFEAGCEFTRDAKKTTGINHNVNKMTNVVHNVIVPEGSSLFSVVEKCFKKIKDEQEKGNSKYLGIDLNKYIESKDPENGKILEYSIPSNSVHTQAVLNTPENRERLTKAGYGHFILDESRKIIEGFETTVSEHHFKDENGKIHHGAKGSNLSNLYWQYHPEGWFSTKNPTVKDCNNLSYASEDQRIMFMVNKTLMQDLMVEPATVAATQRAVRGELKLFSNPTHNKDKEPDSEVITDESTPTCERLDNHFQQKKISADQDQLNVNPSFTTKEDDSVKSTLNVLKQEKCNWEPSKKPSTKIKDAAANVALERLLISKAAKSDYKRPTSPDDGVLRKFGGV